MRWTSAFLFACLLASAPAAAEPAAPCRLCDASGGGLIASAPQALPMALEVQTSLDFDRVILTGPAGGIARLGADGSRATSGALAALTGRAMIGEVVIRGEPGRQIRVDLPTRIDLFGFAGGALAITRISSDLPLIPRLDGDGRLRVRFGGELFVSGDAEGEYRGDVPITVDYL
ncbi:DUF4402 domain-containing protein [Sphingomonas glaciei]|uniref:DUF4402 domain-containing protein n=1 Tax=Sphingomonas glaciei TaxID=2938948 RepID=A0ABY5MTK2_9SPHN|nr:DUF4402 domain-containing protein [Sphingomonas glaciei]UUR07281.1 DUF4402 domain-containing protein [Sphingomonas glaciei]